MMVKKNITDVEEFWNENLCGKHFIDSSYLSEEFFDTYTDFRYRKTHHLDKYIDWQAAKEKEVLEIGLGIGADGCRWAEQAKKYTGVDLTLEAVEATRKHLAIRNLSGIVRQCNAEKLPFENETFNIVYSHGVLHHTTNINNAFAEVERVLDKKGVFIVMLYAKGSFNYWFRIQLYFRLMFLASLIKRKFGLKIKETWTSHLNNLDNKGWAYFSWKEWPHHCTDGPDCEVANIYTKKEVKTMLEAKGFKIEKMKKAHFPAGLPPKLERKLASLFGFHLIVWATKVNS